MAFKKGLQMRPEKRRAFMRQRYEHALDRLHVDPLKEAHHER